METMYSSETCMVKVTSCPECCLEHAAFIAELKRQKSTAIVDKMDSLVIAFFTEKIQRRSHGSHMSKEKGCSLIKSLHFPTTDHPLDSAAAI